MSRPERFDGILLGVCTALSLAPLGLFKYVPATDLPQHVALSAVAFRLLQGDAATCAAYAFNLQPIPYHMAYALLIPAVGLFGPFLGPKVVLVAVALAVVGAMLLLCRALGRSPLLAVGGIFVFYSAVFFWGFVTTLVGIPWVLLCAWALLRHAKSGRTGHAMAAATFAAAACCAHVILVPACFAAIAAYVAMAPRRHRRVAIAVGAAALLPCVPWCVAMLAQPHGQTHHVAWETPIQAWEHLRLYFATFDHGLGRGAHHALIALLIVVSAVARRGATPAPTSERVADTGRFLWTFAALDALLFVVVPLEMHSSQNYVWLVNVRYLVFAEAALFLACKAPSQPRLRSLWRWGIVACLGVFLVGLTQFWAVFERDMRHFDGVLERIPSDATLAVRNGFEHYGRAWPLLTSNMHAYALAQGVRRESSMFEASHMPVRVRPASLGERPHGVGAFEDASADGPVAMAPYDFALIEGSPARQTNIPVPQDGELIYAAGWWRLYRRQTVPTPSKQSTSAMGLGPASQPW